MNDLLTTTFLAALLAGGVTAGMPLLFAALGETVSERAGVLNVGLEGMMLAGGYAGFAAAVWSHYSGVGFLAGAAAGLLASLVMVGLCVWLGLDQVVVGIGLLLLAEGLTSVLQRAQFGTSYPRLEAVSTWSVPGLGHIPILGPGLFRQPWMAYLGIVAALAVWWVLRATGPGLALRAAGEKPVALDAAGGDVRVTRSLAVMTAGALAGLGGAYLSIVGAGIFVPFMTRGAGFVAIAIAMLGRGRVSWVVGASLVFGMSVSLSTALQLVGVSVPQDLLNMIPFLVVLVALAVFGRRSYLPAALAMPYRRGAR